MGLGSIIGHGLQGCDQHPVLLPHLTDTNDELVGGRHRRKLPLSWLRSLDDRKTSICQHRCDGGDILIEAHAPNPIGIGKVDVRLIADISDRNPDQASFLDTGEGFRTNRRRRREIGMSGNLAADAVRAIAPAMIDAGEAFTPHEAMGKTHPAMRATIVPGADEAGHAPPDSEILALDKAADHPTLRYVPGECDGRPSLEIDLHVSSMPQLRRDL